MSEVQAVAQTNAPKKLKVKKAVVSETPAPTTDASAPVDATSTTAKKVSKPSKTTTANIDEIINVLMNIPGYEIPEKVVREKIAHLLPTTSVHRKNRKNKKDPNAPKKALSPYIIFAKEQRSVIKEVDPNLSFVDITKRLGEMWNKLDNKAKYNEMAEADKVRYASANAEYVKAHPVVEEVAKVVAKASRAQKAPKAVAEADAAPKPKRAPRKAKAAVVEATA